MTGLLTGLRNEWRLVGRHPLTWAAIVGGTLFSAMVVKGSPADPADGAGAALRWLNLFLPMFVLPFVAGALAPIIYLREVSHEMDGIVGSYPLPLRRWLAMRAGSLFLLLMLVCLLAEISFVVTLHGAFPGQLANLATNALGWLFLIHCTTCLAWASALALIACRFPSSGVLYVSAAAGWLGYLTIATLTGTPMIAGSFVAFAPLKQAMLVIDPYAATALLTPMADHGLLRSRVFDVTAGRVIWLAFSIFLLGRIAAVPALRERAARPSRWTMRGSSARLAGPVSLHLRFVTRDKVFLLLVIGWVVMLLPEVLSGADYVEPFAIVVPDSRDALNRVMWDMVGSIGPVLLLYFADRICRLYSATRMAELYAATPQRPAALIGVQLVSMWLIAAGFVALAGLSVLAAQLAAGSPIQVAEYGAQLGLVLSRLLIFAALFVAVHGLLRSRIAANLAAAALVALGSATVASALGFNHPLARPLATPLSAPDAVWGYGGSLSAHWQLTAFWSAVALAALLLANVWHHRTLPFAQRRAAQALKRPATVGAIAMLAFVAILGTRIDATLRAEGALVTSTGRDAWRAQYERRFGAWQGRAQPAVEAIRSRVDFYPVEQRVRLESAMTLVNRTDAPIARLLIGRNLRDPGAGAMRLDGATIESRDAQTGQAIYRLARPLEPGARTTLRFTLALSQSGLSAAAAPVVLREGFSALPINELLPVVGFEPRFLLRDAQARREQGLPPLATTPPSRLPAPRAGALRDDLVMLDSIVSTAAGQQVIAQDDRVAAWRAGGRSFVRFTTPMPIRNMPAFFSVPWHPASYAVGSKRIELFAPRPVAASHPTILGAADTLAWLDRSIGSYPGQTLNIVATPEIGLTGYALPQIVELSDRFAFRAVGGPDAEFSQAYRRAAHETSHQWFGHLLGHGLPEERAFMVESLAKYAELVMVERRYGKKAMRALVAYERERYREQRIDPAPPVVPLVDADDGPDMYSRATLAFACLRARVGDDRIIEALRQAIEAQAGGKPVRSIDFVDRLTALAPPKARSAVTLLLLGTDPVKKALSISGCGAGVV